MINLFSTSSSRAKILDECGYKYRQFESGFDEEAIETKEPVEFAYTATLGKFNSSLKQCSDNILVADSVVSVNGKLLRKPKDRDEAQMMLELEGKYGLEVITAMIALNGEVKLIDMSSTFVKFSNLNLKSYLDSELWVGKAGGLMIESKLMKSAIDEITGSYSGARGLACEKLRLIYV